MATKKQKQQLIDVLKFTPRTYTISMWGYGGERVMGTVDRKVWDYCVANQVDLQDIAWDDICEELGLDADMLPFPPGSWYECDDMGHTNGVSRNAGTIQILDENGDTIFEKSLEACDGGSSDSPSWSCSDEVWVGSRKQGEIVFVGSSNEKGTFFEGEIELRAQFDIEKLELHYEEFDDDEIVNCVYYDGEEIDNNSGSTNGKSSDFVMVMITNDEGNFVRYDPNEPVDVPASACTSETVAEPELELTEWLPKSIKPVRIGRYEAHVNIKPVWPWPAETMLEWTGKNWKDADGNVVKDVVEWRGVLGPTE